MTPLPEDVTALKEQLDHTFTYHPPIGDQLERYQKIREAAKEFGNVIAQCTPRSREQSLAITALEEAVMRANQSIALSLDG